MKWGKTPYTYVGQDAHFAPVLNFAICRPQRETLQSVNVLCVERKWNGPADHTFKLSKKAITNKVCAIEV